MEAITTGITNLMTIVGTTFTAITDNQVTVLFLAASLVGVGLSVFSQMKGAAR